MKIELTKVQKMIDWLKVKLYLDAMKDNACKRTVKRGQVYQCNFGCGIGSEMQKNRPAVIVQNNVGNQRSGNTIVIPITHDTSTLPCAVNLTPTIDESGNIILDGQANTSNIMCVSKARLGDYITVLSNADLKAIDLSIARTMDLMGYHADLMQRLNDKLEYITKLKAERNAAQDELVELRTILGLAENESIKDRIIKLKNDIDNIQ